MALDEYLHSLREGEPSDPGQFTVAADRARELLATRVLADEWTAWSCLAQGLIQAGARRFEIELGRQAVVWRADFETPRPLVDLYAQERFLLGWLNLGRFGSPYWSAAESTLTVELRGNAFTRYRAGSALEAHLRKVLALAPIAVEMGRSEVVERRLPAGCSLCLYPLAQTMGGGLRFAEEPRERDASLCRVFSLSSLGADWEGATGDSLGAYASRSKASWSQVAWVHHGVVICQERNTLERPGVSVVASVEALGLTTDLSGFSVVNNEAYFRFITLLKRDVLWML